MYNGERREKGAIGIDLGATNLRIAYVDIKSGEIYNPKKIQLEEREPRYVIRKIKGYLEEKSIDDRVCVGIGVAAWLSKDGTTIVNAPNLGWKEVNFFNLWKEEVKNPLVLLNDLRAIGIGEYYFGIAKNTTISVFVYLGSGIGSTVIIGGIPLEGSGNIAGEIGHIKIKPSDGRSCGCGGEGCLEAYVGGHNIEKRVREDLKGGIKTIISEWIKGEEEINCGLIDLGARSNDPYCISLWEEVSTYLAMSCGGMITYFNPDMLVIGGGVWNGAKLLREMTLKKLPNYVSEYSLKMTQIREGILGEKAGILGSAFWGYKMIYGF